MTGPVMALAVFAAIMNMAGFYPEARTLKVQQTVCLTEAIYHEARGEPELGRRYVAAVILNRVANQPGQTICGVIAAKGQFPWRRHTPPVREHTAFVAAARLAVEAQLGIHAPTLPVMFFYDWRQANPGWARGKPFVRVGGHKFIIVRKAKTYAREHHQSHRRYHPAAYHRRPVAHGYCARAEGVLHRRIHARLSHPRHGRG